MAARLWCHYRVQGFEHGEDEGGEAGTGLVQAWNGPLQETACKHLVSGAGSTGTGQS